jgi:hypothetical protein
MRFAARQWIALDRPGFNWTAKVGRFGLLRVSDQLIEGDSDGSVRLLGLIPLVCAKRSDALTKGELMRYLAELPWAPDAILMNSELRWSELPGGRLRVSTTMAGIDAAMLFMLDADGLVSTVDAPDRPRQEGSAMRERPWRGTFSHYRRASGRIIPHSAEVAWEVDGTRFPVWRGRLEAWSIRPGHRNGEDES